MWHFLKSTGSADQKLRWQFRLYDKDGSGSVELSEMIEILVMIYKNELGCDNDFTRYKILKRFGLLESM